MKESISLIRNNRLFFTGLLLIFITGISLLFISDQVAGFISSNDHHSFGLNVLFINITFMGDSIFAVCLAAVLYFYFEKRQESRAILFTFLISGITIQLIKNLLSTQQPGLFFEAGRYLSSEGSVSPHTGLPSGHTAMAFAIATVLIIMQKNKKWQLPILAAAVLVGYSRIYLAQHSLQDILTGAFIGSVAGVLAVYLSKNTLSIKTTFKKLHRIENSSSPSSPVIMSPGK